MIILAAMAVRHFSNDFCVLIILIPAFAAVGDMYCSGNDLSNFSGPALADPQKMAHDARHLLQFRFALCCSFRFAILGYAF
jgi:hypothetical protein